MSWVRMHARYFASAQGRFSSADTFVGSNSNPQTLNLYAYVQNNPLAFSDPTGHIADDHGLFGALSGSFSDIPWTVAPSLEPSASYAGDGLLGPGELISDEYPQNPQEQFEASAEYHLLLVSYAAQLQQLISGADVRWNARIPALLNESSSRVPMRRQSRN